MGKIDCINVKNAQVSGIKNPTFHMYGNCNLDEYDLEVYVDGIKRKVVLKKEVVTKSYELFLDLNKKDKDIEVYLVSQDEKILICQRKNNLMKRIKSKIRSKCANVEFHNGKYLIIAILKEIKHAKLRISIKSIKRRYYSELNSEPFYNFLNQKDYLKWLEEFPEQFIQENEFQYSPLISICIPVYNVERIYLKECLESILNQTYQNFEICLSNDCSTLQETIDTLNEYEQKDQRIKVFHRKENGHISKATNDALKMAKGEFIGLMDNDDILSPYALAECVNVLNEKRDYDFVYTDEDKLDMNGKRRDPHFKSDYAPDSFLGSNYICHFEIIRKSIIDEIGGFRVGYEGAQDYDLFLRALEKTTPDKVKHIPKILYHWRMIEGSTAATIDSKGYAVEKGRMAVEDSLRRRHIDAEVSIHPNVPYYLVRYHYEIEPMISIIIPTRDYADITEKCLKSIFEKTCYHNFEVILMNNNSQKEETFELFDKYSKMYSNFRVIDANYEFNYSKINNQGVKEAKGEYIVLLNNDTEIITPNWLDIMVGYAMQSHIGIVGTKLLYPDDTIQHAGVIIGVGGIANHAFVGCSKDDPGFYGRLSVPFNYSAVTAACLMISKNLYNEVNGLDEELQVAFNDVDLNLKVLTKGYYNVCLNHVLLYHYESKSRGIDTNDQKKYKRFLHEHEIMYSKWKDKLEKDIFYNVNLGKYVPYKLDKKSEKRK